METVTEKKFLTNEELQQLKDIQSKTQIIVLELGEIEMIKIQLENRYKEAKEFLENLSTQEKEFTNSVFEKYGKSSINPNDGEITKLD
jgi:hypothetical protein